MTESIKGVLKANAGELALVVGNGLLRASGFKSWEKMLKDLAIMYPGLEYHDQKRLDLSLPELSELIEIKDGSRKKLIDTFLSNIENMPMDLRGDPDKLNSCRYILHWAKHNQAPILTTNFDKTLEATVDLKKFTTIRRIKTDFYPWETYYSHRKISDPRSGFAVWHIHGVVDYKRSIRLSLADYMAMVSRARGYLVGNKGALFATRNIDKWKGSSTWLDIFFRSKLVFIGLGLQTQEVFLRWLLIQRKKYLQKNRIADMGVWFVIPGSESGDAFSGRRAFLEALGVRILQVESYSHIYEKEVWAT
jgi:hypothetical protein